MVKATCQAAGRPAAQFLMIFLLMTGLLPGQQSLSITDGSTSGLSPTTIDVLMTNDAPVEGYVLAITFDSTLLAATAVTTDGTVTEAANAELVVIEFLTEGVTAGVVIDAASPFDGQTIPIGTDQVAVHLTLEPVFLVSISTDTAVMFIDGELNDPPLSNVFVQGGLSVGASQGLGLNNGTVTMELPPPDQLRVEDSSGPADGYSTSPARVLLTNNSGAVQGFVVALAHDPAALELTAITLTGTVTQSMGAEFVVPMVLAEGGTIGVVLDFSAPFDGQTIPPGNNNHIVNFEYLCVETIYLPDESQTSTLDLVNGTLGAPALDNVIVVGGMSLSPELFDGTFTCLPVTAPPVQNSVMIMDTSFDEDSGNYAYHGQTGKLCFYYIEPDDEIQGFTITACYDCDLTVKESTFDLNGSIVEEVGAEFVNHQVDDDCSDGETGELIIAILLDALPPFDNQSLPPTNEPLLVGCIDINVDMSAECETLQEIYFCDGIDGNGVVALYNNLVIDYQSIQDYERIDTSIYVVPQEIFQRGDCNSDDKVDLADAASVLGVQFFGLGSLCHDACDANDDGTINLADSVFLLNWLFKFGPEPLDPGPFDNGPDPTEDMLPVCDSPDTQCG
ncbi:MAG TPA: hypothetical protein EYN79_07685 [Planctomycetes bacterium]|nr:hypothetical protein [Planctomycetota bacterium]HIN79918.1 hypothetical protein [Planctomycetota bacterium]